MEIYKKIFNEDVAEFDFQQVGLVSVFVLLFMFPLCVILIGAALISKVSHQFGVIVHAYLLIQTVVFFVISSFRDPNGAPDVLARGLNTWSTLRIRIGIKSMFIVTMLIALMTIPEYAQLARYVNLSYGGFSTDSTGATDWFRYGLTFAVDTYLGVTKLNHDFVPFQATTGTAATLEFIFSIMLQFYLIASIIVGFRILRSATPRINHSTFSRANLQIIVVVILAAVMLFTFLGTLLAIVELGIAISTALSILFGTMGTSFSVILPMAAIALAVLGLSDPYSSHKGLLVLIVYASIIGLQASVRYGTDNLLILLGAITSLIALLLLLDSKWRLAAANFSAALILALAFLSPGANILGLVGAILQVPISLLAYLLTGILLTLVAVIAFVIIRGLFALPWNLLNDLRIRRSFRLANRLLEGRRFEEVITLYNKQIGRFPNYSGFLMLSRAKLNMAAGHYAQAQRDFDAVSVFASDDPDFNYFYSLLLICTEQYDEAATMMGKSVKYYGSSFLQDHVYSLTWKGLIQSAVGDLDSAREHFADADQASKWLVGTQKVHAANLLNAAKGIIGLGESLSGSVFSSNTLNQRLYEAVFTRLSSSLHRRQVTFVK